VAINILTNNYKEGIELSNKVRDILDQYVDNNIGQSRLKNSSEAYTEFEFLQTLNYEFILK
jgi:hypothetical protein